MGEVVDEDETPSAIDDDDAHTDTPVLYDTTLPVMEHVAVLFAGQGAQHPGMGKELAEVEPSAQAIFDAADEVRPHTSDQCFEGSPKELAITANTQPCVFTCDLACAAALTAHGIRPACVAGFSLGELAALTYAGTFSLSSAFSIVLERARLMEKASEDAEGSMVAVLKLEPETVEKLARQSGDCWAVNYNSPQQTVVAGRPDAIAQLSGLVREAGGRSMPLAVSGAFHSPLMSSASQELLPYLQGFSLAEPELPVWANTTAAPYPADREAIARLIANQVSNPVRWTDTLHAMSAQGITTFIEVGAGHVLTGLVKRTLPDAQALSVETPEQLEAALAALAPQDSDKEASTHVG